MGVGGWVWGAGVWCWVVRGLVLWWRMGRVVVVVLSRRRREVTWRAVSWARRWGVVGRVVSPDSATVPVVVKVLVLRPRVVPVVGKVLVVLLWASAVVEEQHVEVSMVCRMRETDIIMMSTTTHEHQVTERHDL